MQICTLPQTDNHTSTPQLSFIGWMPFLPTNQQHQNIESMNEKLITMIIFCISWTMTNYRKMAKENTHSYNCLLYDKCQSKRERYTPNINPNTITDNSVASKKNFNISHIAYTHNHIITQTQYTHTHSPTHTYTTILRPSLILSGTTPVSLHQKGKTNLDLLEQEIVSGSDISWVTCKSAPWPRHITTPAFHHSVFTRDSIYAIARIRYGNSVCLSVCLSVCPSVCHTGGSVKNGWS